MDRQGGSNFNRRRHTEINKILDTAEMKAFFLKAGAEAAPMKAVEFEQFIATEISRWKKIAAAVGIQAE